MNVDFEIIDNEKLDNVLTIVLYDHKDLDKIRKDSGKLAKSNEYQCHYFALVRTEKTDNATVHIVVPLVYYNYKQQVSFATIDFNMNDVTEIAKKLEKVARLQAKRATLILKEVPYTMLDNAEISYKLTYYNNIHRHP